MFVCLSDFIVKVTPLIAIYVSHGVPWVEKDTPEIRSSFIDITFEKKSLDLCENNN